MIKDSEGAGIFLEGNFGSGKSHFLTVMSLIFNHMEAWQPLLIQEPGLIQVYENLSHKKYLTVEVSLVEYSSNHRLEEIVSKSIAEACFKYDPPLFADAEALPERKKFFGRLKQGLRADRVSGVFLLIDELSEFLRSKPDSRSFNEDIRFLQYLGEKAPSFPMWIVATLQESIEDTGQTTQEAFNKIKDRYPLRLFLTGTHIEQLISKRLIRIKDNKRELVSGLFSTLKGFFPHLPVNEERFISLYPVHPATISFLDNLKPLFSQHRGIVDFIHYQLAGDPGRDIEGMGHLPYDSLLTPDRIFDHFRVRIKERVELNPFIEVVYKYYEDEMSNIFGDETEENLAFRILKVLILMAISPVKKRLVVKDIAEMLLYRITELESSINYQYIRDILERLHKGGAYISMDKGNKPLEDHFHINLEADISLLVKRATEYQVGSFFEDDVRLFSRLKELLDDPRLPLKEYEVSTQTKVRFLWQSTQREGIFLMEQVDRLTPERLDDIILKLNKSEADFAVIMGTTHRLGEQRNHLHQVILPHLKERNVFYIRFWLPHAIPQESLKETLAHLLLLAKYADDTTERGNEIRNFIEGLLVHEKRLIKENFMDIYHKGSLFSVSSGDESIQESMKFKVFQDFLSSMGEGLLEARYPAHGEIAPYTSFATKDQFQEVVEDLFKKGEVIIQKGTRHGLKRVIEGFLVPMKVAKSTPKGFQIGVDPKKSVLVERFLELAQVPVIDGKSSLEGIYWKLRKGEFGLSRPQFELLALVLIFSGHIVPFSKGRRKNPDEVSMYALKNIDEVAKGEVLSGEFQKGLSSLPFIPRKYKNKELNLLTQKELWKELLEIRGQATMDLENLREKIHRASEYKALAGFDLGELNKSMDELRLLFDEVKISYDPKDGIERFLNESKNHPFLDKSFSRFEAARRFFAEDLDRYLFISSYVDHPDLNVPEEQAYETIGTRLADIKACLKSGTPYLEEGYMENLNTLFDHFLQEYTLLYQREHKLVTSPEGFFPYDRVKDSLRYKILTGFSKIEYISVRNDRVKVERALSDVSSTRCPDFSMETLRHKPVCRCGFRLGERRELPGIQALESTIDQGIKEYLASFQEAAIRERFISYSAGLKEVGKKSIADKIHRLMDFDISHMEKDPDSPLKELSRILDNDVIKAINDAFSGKVVVVLRDLDEFYENTVDRSFPKERLLSIFQEWLQGGEDLKEETYIKITGSRKRTPGASSYEPTYGVLSDLVDKRYPELTGLCKRLGNEDFNLVFFLCLWARNHHIEKEDFQRLLGEIKGGHTKEILSLWKSLVSAAEYVSANQGEEVEGLMEEAERSLNERGLDNTLFDMVRKSGTFLDYFRVIEREEVLFFPVLRAFENCMKKVGQDASGIDVKTVEQAMLRQRETGGSKRMKKDRILRTLMHVISLETAIHSLSHDQSEEESAPFWEHIYLSSLWSLYYDYCYVNDSLNQLGLLDEIHFYRKKRALDALSKTWAKAFQGFYLRTMGNMEQDKRKKRPMRINDVPNALFQRFKKASGKDTGYFILLDGMRWDLWKYIKENTFFARSLNYRILEEVPLWALHPTTTEVQIRSLLDSALQLDMVADIEASYTTIKGTESSLTDAYQEIELDNSIKIVKFGFIDNKVHQSKDDLITLFREVCVNMEVSVKNYVDRLPKGSLIFLFSDHGFVENMQFKGHKDEPRYLHGGASPWEVIVPFVAMLKI
jgi:hypothetical protein